MRRPPSKSRPASRKSNAYSIASSAEAALRKHTQISTNKLFDMFREREESFTSDDEAPPSPRSESGSVVFKSNANPPRQWPPPSNATPSTLTFDTNEAKPKPKHDSARPNAGSTASTTSSIASTRSTGSIASASASVSGAAGASKQKDTEKEMKEAESKEKQKQQASNPSLDDMAKEINKMKSAEREAERASSVISPKHGHKHSRYRSVMNFIEMDVKPQMEKLEKENDRIRKELSHAKGVTDDLKKENDHLNNYIEDLKEQLRLKEFNEDAIKIAKLEQENREMQLQVNELHDISIKYAALQEQNQTIMEINQSLQKQIGTNGALSDESRKLDELIKQFNNEQSRLINELKRENEQLLESAKQSENKNKELTNQIVALEQRDLFVRKKNSISVYDKDRTKSSHTKRGSNERNGVNKSGNGSVSSSGRGHGSNRSRGSIDGSGNDEVLRLRAELNQLKKVVRKAEDTQNTTCAKCNLVIKGRPYKASNGKSYHRECHKCDGCGTSLVGKRFGIMPLNDGTEKRMCETCTAKHNEDLIKKAQAQDAKNGARRIGHTKQQSGSSQLLAAKLNALQKLSSIKIKRNIKIRKY